jgi:hypothetical protein
MGAHKNRRRMRPAPQGRAYREQRHYCHITIQVSSDKPEGTDEQSLKAAKRATARKLNENKPAAPKTSKKTETVKETKKSKTEEVTAEEAPILVAEPITETVSPKATEASKETAENTVVQEASAETPAEQNATKPADEAQIAKNEELERQ